MDWLAYYTKELVPVDGIEPPTNGLQNRCSTPELSRQGNSPIFRLLGKRGLSLIVT